MQIVCLSAQEFWKSTKTLPKPIQAAPTNNHYLSLSLSKGSKTPQDASKKIIVLHDFSKILKHTKIPNCFRTPPWGPEKQSSNKVACRSHKKRASRFQNQFQLSNNFLTLLQLLIINQIYQVCQTINPMEIFSPNLTC